ncbi:uncharacterized protein [Drosophila kikkawai]|uniref:MD-2-related lipid-recognition domain-containing protein n=1 Tax=Drosophila kikkawai TaxID=30033 RepID=A0A6P4IU61_DROKI|nr:uncharacterized protein LOC108077915 [Drosophila kikkawai]
MAISGLLLLGCCLMWQGTHDQLVCKLVKIDCLGNPARIINISCHLKAINWNLAVVKMDTFLIVPLRKPVIRLQVFKKDYSNQYKPFLIDVTVNMCEIIDKRSYIPYGVIFWKLLIEFTNANHSCPFTCQLTARNGYLYTSLVPPFPLGFYLVSILFTDISSSPSEYVGTAKLYVQVMEQVKTKKKPRV